MASREKTTISVLCVYLILAPVTCNLEKDDAQSYISRTRTRRGLMPAIFQSWMKFQYALSVLKSRADFAGIIGDTKVYYKNGGLRDAAGEFGLLNANKIHQFDTGNGVFVKLGNIAPDTFVKLNSKDRSVRPPSSTIEVWKASTSSLGDVKCVTKIVYKG